MFDLLYNIAAFFVKLYYKIFYFAKAEGIENIPKTGGVILCGNHKSFNDPVVVAAFSTRKLKFLAKAELFKNKFFSWFLKGVGCVPVDRGSGDLKAMRTCIKVLKEDNLLLLFPEGTRSCVHIDDVKPGAMLFATKAEVPIVPVGISKLHLFGHTKVRFGKPIYYNDYYNKKISSEEYRKLTNNLIYEIYKLVDDKCCYYDEIKASVENEN